MTEDNAREIGRLEGRVDAIEARQNRHETLISQMFGEINVKLDGLKAWQDSSIGARRERGVLLTLLIAAATAVGGWLGHATIGAPK